MGQKALKTRTFWKSHFPFDSKMIADTRAILFVLIMASEWFAGLLSHPILYWERKRLCWLSVKEGRQSPLLFSCKSFEIDEENIVHLSGWNSLTLYVSLMELCLLRSYFSHPESFRKETGPLMDAALCTVRTFRVFWSNDRPAVFAAHIRLTSAAYERVIICG